MSMAERIQFFLLDITYKVIDEKPLIYLFGKTSKGDRICIIDEGFEPYFWVIPKKGQNIQKRIEETKATREEKTSEVTRTEQHNKKYFGKDVTALKVFTKLPRDVPILRDELKNLETVESINEYDIPFVMRYLIDKKLTPLTLIEADAEPAIAERLKVPAFKAERIIQFSEDIPKNPRILAFDIETYNPKGKNIDMENNPIIMLSFYSENFKKVFTWKRFKTDEDYIEFVEGESHLIEEFIETIETFRPDILVGYYSDGFDFPYIEKRAEKYKIKLGIGLDYSEAESYAKKKSRYEINGIPHVDILNFISKAVDIPSLEFFGLDNVASEILGEKKINVELDKLAEAWDSKHEELEEFCKYNLHDSYLAYSLAEKMLPNMIEVVKIVGLPLFDVTRMGFSQLVEWYLLKQAPNFNEISPNKPHHDEIKRRRMQTYKGASVYEPTPGLYKNLVVFDYRSLYPTIISSHNISPATLNCGCCKDEVDIVPFEDKKHNHWFCKKKKGFLPTVIEDLITRRMRIKEIMKDKYDVFLDARQNTLKILANAFYGYYGFFAARWYSIESAQSITAYGRYYIMKVIEKAQKSEFNVVYSDTDSVFITLDGKTRNDAMKFSEAVNLELPGIMELEYKGLYPSAIFVSAKVGDYGAKKKYALLAENGKIEIKGFETVRRNWSPVAKETQENLLRIVLKENDAEKALEYARKVIDSLKNHKVSVENVTIRTQLQKEISEYDTVGPHVEIAKRMKEKGIDVSAGSLIKYVVVKGAERIRDRARLPEEIEQEDYDADYYINNQIVPAVERIFNVLGYTKEDLTGSKEQSKLGKFFK